MLPNSHHRPSLGRWAASVAVYIIAPPKRRSCRTYGTDLQNLLEQFPIVTRRLLDLVSERFVHVLLDLESTSFKHLMPRLTKVLLEKAEVIIFTT